MHLGSMAEEGEIVGGEFLAVRAHTDRAYLITLNAHVNVHKGLDDFVAPAILIKRCRALLAGSFGTEQAAIGGVQTLRFDGACKC